MSKPHKWAKEIIAWANGAEIEYKKYTENEWMSAGVFPAWYHDLFEYRIKSQPKEPQYLYVYEDKNGFPVLGTNKYSGCIGKIKLETEDE